AKYGFSQSARAIDEARLPSAGRVREAFEARGFSTVALDPIEQEIDPSLAAHSDRIERRALSSFELITDSEFERGLALMRAAVDREADPIPVREKVDLLVLRRSRDEVLS